jgi:hypothetical protein
VVVEVFTGDLTTPGEAQKGARGQGEHHLSSGGDELDFDKGYLINLEGTRHLFEAVWRADYRPRWCWRARTGSRFGDGVRGLRREQTSLPSPRADLVLRRCYRG